MVVGLFIQNCMTGMRNKFVVLDDSRSAHGPQAKAVVCDYHFDSCICAFSFTFVLLNAFVSEDVNEKRLQTSHGIKEQAWV